jgi:hypothetical protein
MTDLNTEIVVKTYYNTIGTMSFTLISLFGVLIQKKKDAVCIVIILMMCLNLYELYFTVTNFRNMVKSINKSVFTKRSLCCDLLRIFLCTMLPLVTPTFSLNTLMEMYDTFPGFMISTFIYGGCILWILLLSVAIFFVFLTIISITRNIHFNSRQRI